MNSRVGAAKKVKEEEKKRKNWSKKVQNLVKKPKKHTRVSSRSLNVFLISAINFIFTISRLSVGRNLHKK